IGFLAGIVAFGVVKNTWGFLTLIPLVIIFKLVNDPKSKRLREIESERKKRKLK
ncbi:MAG: FUSC family protein, partial [Flavobacteriales bacterium]|nr:FUSC family protein [Flavobacteriales bacterium]